MADGTTIVENTEKCSACDTGFRLNPANECIADATPPAVVTDLTASRPRPLVGTVKLDWTEPADADFSHLLISWTPNVPTNPIQVNKGTMSTVIASGLTVGTAYTFTAISVDTADNESAASTGATATPVSCPNPFFATTNGETYGGSVNVASGLGTAASPYLIPLVAGVPSTCPIDIDFDHSGEPLVGDEEYFRIDNMPTGASYTSSTLAWTFKSVVDGRATIQYRLNSDGSTVESAFDGDVLPDPIAKANVPDMGAITVDTDFAPTNLRTLGFFLLNPAATDSLTLTLTP